MKSFKVRMCFFGFGCYSGTLRNRGLPSFPLWYTVDTTSCVGAAGGKVARLVDVIENAGQVSAITPLKDPSRVQMPCSLVSSPIKWG